MPLLLKKLLLLFESYMIGRTVKNKPQVLHKTKNYILQCVELLPKSLTLELEVLDNDGICYKKFAKLIDEKTVPENVRKIFGDLTNVYSVLKTDSNLIDYERGVITLVAFGSLPNGHKLTLKEPIHLEEEDISDLFYLKKTVDHLKKQILKPNQNSDEKIQEVLEKEKNSILVQAKKQFQKSLSSFTERYQSDMKNVQKRISSLQETIGHLKDSTSSSKPAKKETSTAPKKEKPAEKTEVKKQVRRKKDLNQEQQLVPMKTVVNDPNQFQVGRKGVITYRGTSTTQLIGQKKITVQGDTKIVLQVRDTSTKKIGLGIIKPKNLVSYRGTEYLSQKSCIYYFGSIGAVYEGGKLVKNGEPCMHPDSIVQMIIGKNSVRWECNGILLAQHKSAVLEGNRQGWLPMILMASYGDSVCWQYSKPVASKKQKKNTQKKKKQTKEKPAPPSRFPLMDLLGLPIRGPFLVHSSEEEEQSSGEIEEDEEQEEEESYSDEYY